MMEELALSSDCIGLIIDSALSGLATGSAFFGLVTGSGIVFSRTIAELRVERL